MKKPAGRERGLSEWESIWEGIGADRRAELSCYQAVQKIRQVVRSGAGEETLREEVNRILRDIGLE